MILETRHPIAEILSRQPLFRGLSELELEQLSRGCREFRVSKNEVLFHKGDTPAGMHVLIMGQIKLALPSNQGTEKVVHMCGPGATFGEAVVFLGKPYPVTGQATLDSIVLLVSSQALLEAVEASPMLGRKMLASLSTRLHELLEDMETCTLRTSAQRVLCFLNQGAPAGNEPRYDVVLSASKQTIASQLNLAPETLSRVLGHLTEAGLIQVRGRTITVLDREKLKNYGT